MIGTLTIEFLRTQEKGMQRDPARRPEPHVRVKAPGGRGVIRRWLTTGPRGATTFRAQIGLGRDPGGARGHARFVTGQSIARTPAWGSTALTTGLSSKKCTYRSMATIIPIKQSLCAFELSIYS